MRNAAPLLALLVLCASALAQQPKWNDNLEKAQKKAAKEGKDVFIVVSGAPWDMRSSWFEEKILKDEEFAEFVKDYVLVKISVPQSPDQASAKFKKKLRKLFIEHNVVGIPVMIFLDGKGRPYASLTYSNGDIHGFLVNASHIKIAKVIRDALFKASELSRTDQQKAHYLHQALSVVGQLTSVLKYEEEIDQIIKYDRDNVHGLRDGYLALRMLAEVRQLIIDRKPREAAAEAKRFVEKYPGDPETTQLALYYQAVASQLLGDYRLSAAHLRAALQMAPESRNASLIAAALEMVRSRLEAEEPPEEELGEDDEP